MTKPPRKTSRKRARPAPRPQVGMALHTADGARKYLTAGERDAFLRAAEQAERQVRTLCMTLAYAGCRLSEALALTVDRVDLVAGVLVLESLKKRRSVMAAARLDGPHASPKGLRHGFGVAALSAGIPLNLVQKWLGHAQLTTTAIYADAVGEEEQSIAARMW